MLSATAILALAQLQFEKTQLEQCNKLTNVKHETNKFHLPSVPAITQNLTLRRLQYSPLLHFARDVPDVL